MKKFNLALLVTMICVFVLGAATVYAEDVLLDKGPCGENTYYEMHETKIGDTIVVRELLVSGNGIIDTYGRAGYPWYAYMSQITKLTLNGEIKNIPDYAFCDFSEISEIVIPDTVESIGDYAFYCCTKLACDIVIPESVTTIGEGAFACEGAPTNIRGDLIISSNVELISKRAFANTFYKGKLVLPKKLKTIEYGAFMACRFSGNLVLPEGLESIGERAFSECDGFIGDLVIPETVTVIGNYAFLNCTCFDGKLVLPASLKYMETDYTKDPPFSGCGNFNVIVNKSDIPLPVFILGSEKKWYDKDGKEIEEIGKGDVGGNGHVPTKEEYEDKPIKPTPGPIVSPLNAIEGDKATLIVEDKALVKIKGVDTSVLLVKGKAGTYDPATGVFTAVKKGSATLYFLNGKKKIKVCKIKVDAPKIKAQAKVKMGKTKKLKVTGTKLKVDSYSSSDESVLKVTNEGIVMPVAPGFATVVAKIGDHEYKCVVTVKE